MDVFHYIQNKFALLVLERVALVVLDLGLNKVASDGSNVDTAAVSMPGLSASLSFPSSIY